SAGSPAMNTTELIAKIAETHGVSKAQAKSIVEDIFKDIVDAAASGAEVFAGANARFAASMQQSRRRRRGRGPRCAGSVQAKQARRAETDAQASQEPVAGRGPPVGDRNGVDILPVGGERP